MHRRTAPPTLPNLVDIDTLAAHLGVSVRHVRRLVAERRIPFVKWGHFLRFDPIAIASWLDEQRVEAARPIIRVVGRRYLRRVAGTARGSPR